MSFLCSILLMVNGNELYLFSEIAYICLSEKMLFFLLNFSICYMHKGGVHAAINALKQKQ